VFKLENNSFLCCLFSWWGRATSAKIILEPSIIGVGQLSNYIMGPLLFVYAATWCYLLSF